MVLLAQIALVWFFPMWDIFDVEVRGLLDVPDLFNDMGIFVQAWEHVVMIYMIWYLNGKS